MASQGGGSGSRRLLGALRGEAGKVSARHVAGRGCSWGTIEDGLALRVDDYGDLFPPGAYLVASWLLVTDEGAPTTLALADASPALAGAQTDAGGAGPHQHGLTAIIPHTHPITRAGVWAPLAVGDRVAVAWLSPVDPYVIDRPGALPND